VRVTASSSVHEVRGWPLAGADPYRATSARPALVSHEPTALRVLILIALYAIPAVVVVRPVSDNDIWMNLRAGQWVVDHGAVPETDPFSGYGRERPWVAYSWLFEVLVHGLHERLGLAGIVLYRVVLSFAVLAALHRLVAKRVPRFVVATGLTGLGFFALVPLLNERTWLFTVLFSTLTLDAILDLREGKGGRLGWMLPPLYAVWSNLHIQFVYGLFLLALGCVAPMIDGLLGRARTTGHAGLTGTRDWWSLVVLSGACLAATLLNPYHARLYGVVAGYAAGSDTYNLVLELLAPGFRAPWEWAMPALVGAAAFSLGRRRDLSAFDVLLLSVASFFALRARRDVWFAVLAALAVLSTARLPAGAPSDRFALTRSRASVISGAVLTILVAAGWCLGLSQRRLEEEVAGNYPARAASVVEDRGCRGPLFNEYGWGSYLIWRLPGLPVSIDGRADLHGPARIRRNVETVSGLRGWGSDPDLEAANTVIISAGAALASLLRVDPRFQLVHEDPVAAVFVRRDRAVQPTEETAESRAPGAPGPAVEGGDR
jgi:hypothetical protein